jgi:hypothetical protein
MNATSSGGKLVSLVVVAVLVTGLVLLVSQVPRSFASSRDTQVEPARFQPTTNQRALAFAPETADPQLAWNTFLGIGGNSTYASAIDSAGNVYTTGCTSCSLSSDAFVAKWNSNGDRLWYVSFGGLDFDEGRAIAVDNSGGVYVVGSSRATWGSPVRSFTPNGTKSDAFVAKLSSGGILQWNTFLGSSENDQGFDVAVSGGAVYAIGYSTLTWGAPLEGFHGGADAFVAKLSSSGGLQWNTFRGDAGFEIGFTVVGNGSGVYVSWSNDDNAATTTIAAVGSTGGSGCKTAVNGAVRRMAVGGSGNVYVAGYYPPNGSSIWDAFAAKLNSGCGLIWQTFLGAAGDDAGWGVALDGNENVYVAGDSNSTWGTPIWAFSGARDAFVAKLNSTGNLIWHGFLGGPSGDGGCGIAVDASRNAIYVVGYSSSSWGSPIQPYVESPDSFVAKIVNQFSISGRVQDVNGIGFPGVTISTGFGQPVVTDVGGNYTATLSAGSYTLTPAKAGYRFTPATRLVSVPPDTEGQTFTILPDSVGIILALSGTESLPADLIYTDTQGLDTTLHFPAGTVVETTTLLLTPTLAWGGSGSAWAGHAFEITAWRNNELLSGAILSTPVTVTIHYSANDTRVVSDKNQLMLRWWADDKWQDAAQTCAPTSSYTRDLDHNTLSIPICHLSLFGLFGPTYQTYLPLTLKNH